jgi:hypothetical protein
VTIPKKISIGGIAFKVRFVKFDDDDYGKMDFDQRLILLNQAMKNNLPMTIETLRHEMIHAALAVGGVSFAVEYDEEVIVRCLDSIFFPAWDKLTKTR